jgi:proline iminopeptidase
LLLEVLVAFGRDRDEIYTPDEDARRAIREVLASAPFTPDQWGKAAGHLARVTEDPGFFTPHTPALRQLTQPSLLIKGELDPIPSAGEVLDFRRALPAAEVHVFPGAGHFVQAEKPQAYADLVTDFVTRNAKGAVVR